LHLIVLGELMIFRVVSCQILFILPCTLIRSVFVKVNVHIFHFQVIIRFGPVMNMLAAMLHDGCRRVLGLFILFAEPLFWLIEQVLLLFVCH
jgi:hypothetical protein